MNTDVMTQTRSFSPIEYCHRNVMDRLAPHAHWLLRFALAGVFVYHGFSKLSNVEMFSQMMGLSYSVALLVALAEFSGGIAIIVGSFTKDWLTRLGALSIVPVMIGAISMVHWGRWNFVPSESHPMGGMEFQVTLLLIALYFVIKGNKA